MRPTRPLPKSLQLLLPARTGVAGFGVTGFRVQGYFGGLYNYQYYFFIFFFFFLGGGFPYSGPSVWGLGLN